MEREVIASIIGNQYRTKNIENEEFSYVEAGIPLNSIPQNSKNERNFQLDMRFEDSDNKLSILVETINKKPTKTNIEDHEKKLLEGYCLLENRLKPENNLILILADSGSGSSIKVWKKGVGKTIELLSDSVIKPLEEYLKYFITLSVNNEIKIRSSVLELNEMLHKNSISEDIRGQFVGTCLLALKDKDNSFRYKEKDTNIAFDTSIIIQGIRNVIEKLLNNDIKKAQKIVLLDTNVLNNQKVRNINKDKFKDILDFINKNIIPYINTETSQGQDLLNLFFTTFNKYVGKKDKNQAFTPDHITHFMCKVAEVNKNSKVLDPTCGSGSFIVQALIQELNECNTDTEKDKVRKYNIFGIENEEKAFGLSTTNMLIHGDGNSNVRLEEQLGCFGLRNWIQENDIDIVLMNPPYNAKPNEIPCSIKQDGRVIYQIHNWNKKQKNGKEDPTKGFCFVNYIADCIGKDKNGNLRKGVKLLCLLPLSCAIGAKEVIKEEKRKILQNNTLDAVFTLPTEMFYPGAAVNACCMVFTIGTPHFTKITNTKGQEVDVPRKETFFGYFKNDGFYKKKNLGRISKVNENGDLLWHAIETKWLDLYRGNISDKHLAVKKKVTHKDEWLAEAYMETDYSLLNKNDFQNTLNGYLGYLISNGRLSDD